MKIQTHGKIGFSNSLDTPGEYKFGLSQEFFLILEFAKLSQLLFHLCNFIAGCKGRSQGNTTFLCFNGIHPRGVVVEEGRAKIFQSFNTLLSDAQMLIPFFFIQERRLAFLL